MTELTAGPVEITTYADAEAWMIEVHYNASTSEKIDIRSEQALYDMQYLVNRAVVLHEEKKARHA